MPMSKPTPKKRTLSFGDFEDVIAELNALLDRGYEQHGNWTLGQTSQHLADWIRYPMDGFPRPPIFMRPILWLMKVTIASRTKRKILAEGFDPGIPTAPQSVHDADATSDEAGVAALIETIERAKKFDGELIASPIFGPMDRETWIKVNLLHTEHHLGFLEPR